MRPLVSVVIPTHDRAEQLQEALGSVYGQTGCGKEFDIEVIVVDDASTDHTSDVVRAYPDARCVRLETNRGASTARNIAIRMSRGQYVAFLDDDDYWLPHRLLSHLRVLTARPDVGATFGRHLSRGERAGDPWPATDPSGPIFDAILMEDLVSIDTLLVRREVLERVGYFDEGLATLEHYEFSLRLAFHALLAFIPEPVAVNRWTSRGKGFSHARMGAMEVVLPQVVEKALGMLSPDPEHAEVRITARAAVLWRVASRLDYLGETTRLRAWVLAELRRDPSVIGYPKAQGCVARCAVRLALESETPLAALTAFHRDIQALLADIPDPILRSKIRRGAAKTWRATALTLKYGPRRLDREAGHAAAWAAFFEPSLLRQRAVMKCLVRGVLAGERWDAVVGLLRAVRRVRRP
ncbi:MAG: glycosyltransferase family 2 protein [Candidatus Rokuibacteriota bacterium]